MRGRLYLVAILSVFACRSSGSATSDGHADSPGGGSGDAPGTPIDAPAASDVTCAALPPVGSGATCEVTAGGSTKLVEGNVLTPSTIFHGGQVAINGLGAITCVGCTCATGGETVINCPDATISPGLINPHDHITFTNDPPSAPPTLRYTDRQQWRKGLDSLPKDDPPGGASADQIRWGELRHLMAGTTSIIGAGGEAGLVRNLDKSSEEGGLGLNAVYPDVFPLGDSSGLRRTGDCNYGGTAETTAGAAGEAVYEPHTSEGIDATAHNEFLCESSTTFDTATPGTSNDLLTAHTSMIHAIAVLPADYAQMAAAGTGMIWSPRSNISLYGDTARVTIAARAGVNIALGTDWLPSGSMNIQRELVCADTFNKTYLNGYFTDQQLWAMVTANGAKVAKMDSAIGVLATGKIADLAVFAGNGKPPFRSVIEAQPQDVALVLREGVALYGDDAVVAALATGCDPLSVCTSNKRVCLQSEIGESYATLSGNVGSGMYPAFECGTPTNEPTCAPSRPASVAGSTVYTGVAGAGDSDGDGIPDATDKCPNVFDPIRPMDGSAQADADADGMGDACDPCPLDATNACAP